jgi:adenylylsulfate kinase
MFTLWFTGLSGAGKTTLSKQVYLELKRRSLAAEWLDGDIIRANFSQELGFSRRDRDINVKRLGFVSHLLNKNGVVSVVAAIAPYAQAREDNRGLIGEYVEVFCDCPLQVVAERDVKGLYDRAFKGEIPRFTGVSDPYEAPESPELRVRTEAETVEESAAKVLDHLEACGYVPEAEQCRFSSFSEDQEMNWRRWLADIGYAR